MDKQRHLLLDYAHQHQIDEFIEVEISSRKNQGERFEQIIQVCIDAGLVWGKKIHVDGTLVYANADDEKQVSRFYHQAQQHLDHLFRSLNFMNQATFSLNMMALIHLSNPALIARKPRPVDESATVVGRGRLGYHLHYGIDGGKSRIILKCLVTPVSIQDNTPLLDLIWQTRFRWQLPLRTVVGDAHFGTIQNVMGLAQNHIQAFMPLHTEAKRSSHKNNTFGANRFQFDLEQNAYICPQGEILPYYKTNRTVQRIVYKALDEVCNACSLKSQCKTGRTLNIQTHLESRQRLSRN